MVEEQRTKAIKMDLAKLEMNLRGGAEAQRGVPHQPPLPPGGLRELQEEGREGDGRAGGVLDPRARPEAHLRPGRPRPGGGQRHQGRGQGAPGRGQDGPEEPQLRPRGGGAPGDQGRRGALRPVHPRGRRQGPGEGQLRGHGDRGDEEGLHVQGQGPQAERGEGRDGRPGRTSRRERDRHELSNSRQGHLPRRERR